MDKISNFEALNATKGLKLVHLNVRSVIKKKDQLRILLANLNLDVITMSETWLASHMHTNLVTTDGYDLFRQDRAVKTRARAKKRGSGLLTYVNKKHASLCEPLIELDRSNEYIEAQWLLIHRPHCKNIVICNVYRPPNGDLGKAVTYLDDCLKTINTSKVDLFVMGDFNVNYKNKAAPSYKRLHFFAQSNGLTQYIKNTTRNTDRTNSIIDLAMSNSKFVNHSGTLDHFISDHQPIFLIHKKGRDSRHTANFQGRSYRNYDGGKIWQETFRA